MKWKPYPKYKDSGVEWLGEVPAGWDAKPLGSVARVKARLGWRGLKADEYVDDGYPMLATPNIKDFGIDFESVVYVSEERYLESPEIMLQDGDVLLAKDGSTLGTVNVVRSLPRPSTLNGSIALIRPSASLDPVYTYYWFRGDYVANLIQSLKGGMGVPHLFQSDLRKFRMLIPPSDEQSLIALSLDRETAKIDILVAKQERLIELLQEKRQALISHAVTKGINPDAPMRPSGVEWLGDVPAHWTIAALAYRYEVALGKMLDGKQIVGDQLAAYLRNVDVQWDRISVADLPEMDFAPSDRSRFSLRPGDLIVCEGGDVGRAAIWEGQLRECYYQKALHRLRAHKKGRDNGRFMLYVLWDSASKCRFTASEGRSTIAHLTAEALRRYLFAFPPKDEQTRIVLHLDRECAKVDALLSKVGDAITLMREHRTALISAAVTGKIDVREPIHA